MRCVNSCGLKQDTTFLIPDVRQALIPQEKYFREFCRIVIDGCEAGFTALIKGAFDSAEEFVCKRLRCR